VNNVRQFNPRDSADDDGSNRVPPQDVTAERAVLGGMLLSDRAITEVIEILEGPEFSRLQHERIFQAIVSMAVRGEQVDPITVAAELTQRGELSKVGGAAYLHDLIQAVPTAANAERYAEIVRDTWVRRRLTLVTEEFTQTARDGDGDISAAITRLTEEISSVTRARSSRASHVRELDVLLSEDDEEYDWLVPGLIERMDRIMLTGPEGGGKSTFLRQFAVCCASGIHPFTGELIEPLRVLNLDLENSERQTKRKYRPLRVAAGERYGRTLFVESRPEGIDLLKTEDQEWLQRLVDEVKPDLLTTGPVYKMAGGDPTEEKSSKPVALALDRIRAGGAALLIETHTPHASNGGKRPRRPYGWSGWLRWPEFGIYLGEDGELDHWRGQRDERDWPVMLRRGGEWPWTPVSDPMEVAWGRIRQYRRDFGEHMSYRDIESAVGLPKSTVARVLSKHKDEWTTLNGHPSKGDAA
jgi:hypothetical protein